MVTLRERLEKSRGEPRHLQRGNLEPLKAELSRQLQVLKAVNSGGVTPRNGERAGGVFAPKK